VADSVHPPVDPVLSGEVLVGALSALSRIGAVVDKPLPTWLFTKPSISIFSCLSFRTSSFPIDDPGPDEQGAIKNFISVVDGVTLVVFGVIRTSALGVLRPCCFPGSMLGK
jgi:hypothetical protein